MNEASLEGPVLIEIQESDIAFESEGSGRWTKIDDSYQPEVTNTFGAGWWLVDRPEPVRSQRAGPWRSL